MSVVLELSLIGGEKKKIQQNNPNWNAKPLLHNNNSSTYLAGLGNKGFADFELF